MIKRYSFFRHLTFLKIEQWLSISAFALNAMINIIIALNYGISLFSFVSLVIGSTLSVIFDRINRHIFENKALEDLDRTKHNIDDLECIGGIAEGIEWVVRHMDGLQHVYNTVFTRSDDDYTSASHARIEYYVSGIRHALQNGCQWNDLYGTREKNVIDEFRSSLNQEQISRYNSFEVTASLPMFQYSVLRYKDNRRSVIFGWGFQGGQDDKARVFVSHSKETADFFSDHFHAMRRICMPDARPTTNASLAFNPQPP